MWYLPRICPARMYCNVLLWFLMFFKVCRQASKYNQYYKSPEKVQIYLFRFIFFININSRYFIYLYPPSLLSEYIYIYIEREREREIDR